MVGAEPDLRFDRTLFGPGPEVYVERSVKLTRGTARTDRVLLGAERPRLSRARVLDMADAFGLDRAARDELDLRLGDAFMVHAGREGQGPGATRKLYLEFGEPPADLPDLRFLAWKSRPGRSSVRSLYRRLPLHDRGDIIRALDTIHANGPVRQSLLALVDHAAGHVALTEMMLLLVQEAGTTRASLDLNLYDGELMMADIAPHLTPILTDLGHSSIPGFDGTARAGHVSAGTGREGQVFVTIYGNAQLTRGTG